MRRRRQASVVASAPPVPRLAEFFARPTATWSRRFLLRGNLRWSHLRSTEMAYSIHVDQCEVVNQQQDVLSKKEATYYRRSVVMRPIEAQNDPGYQGPNATRPSLSIPLRERDTH